MSEHDPLCMRIYTILVRLFLGETLSVTDLAHEFNVSKRTIRRDFNDRIKMIPDIEIKDVKKGYFKLSKYSAGSLKTYREILHFSRIIDIDKLFPKHAFDHKFIDILLSNKNHSPCIIYTDSLDDQPSMYGPFLTIIQSIIDRTLITIKTNNEVCNNFAPYQLIHFKRHWYLVGELEKHILVIAYDVIKEIKKIEASFKIDLNISETIQEDDFIQSLPNYTTKILHKINKHNI
ncbi:DeoR family transcriptional regulator [Gilliamella intestini]|uniref:Predicted DNA-binding transcriptional regulator YafY, contains an HTH and WYL domains n=1 Tax=Gilliamella intestini TaxID=1798183 RepID=A0A1C3ZRC2_9GAMM|nr:DeoR family transcriptional regulator [Gilliamella intestini]SCB84928.1 Predicted DNA-binding transcriptional regulator YafY, contains an HTH and WYL domains [Gilliamella intestini]